MDHTPLVNGMIPNPELWSLALQLRASGVDVMIYPPSVADEPVVRSYEFDLSVAPLKALEDVIYANTLLFSDFKSVDCYVDAPSFMLVPRDASLAQCSALFGMEFPGADQAEGHAEFYDTGTLNAKVMQVMDAECKSFLSRTFYNIRFHNRLAALCGFFARKGMDGHSAVYALMDDSRLTLVVLDGEKLLLANDFECGDADTAAYYVLAAMNMLSLPADTEVCLHSSLPGSDAITALRSRLSAYCPATEFLELPPLGFAAGAETFQVPFIFLLPHQ